MDPSSEARQAAQRLSEGRLQEAAVLYRRVLFHAPDDVDALKALAMISHQTGDLPGALSHMTSLARLLPDDPRVRTTYARLLRESSEPERARRELERAVELDAAYVPAWVSLGVLLRAAGDTAGAARCYERALQVEPGNATAALNLANLQAAGGQREEAEQGYRRLLQTAPALPEVWSNLAALLLDEQRVAESLACLREGRKHHPSSAAIAVQLGDLLRRTGAAAEALELAEQALRVAPFDPGALLLLGNTLREQGDSVRAVAAYEACLRIEPRALHALTGLALIELNRGRLDDAERFAERGLELDPHNEGAWLVKFETLIQKGALHAADTGFQPFLDRTDCSATAYQCWIGLGLLRAEVSQSELTARIGQFEPRFAPRQRVQPLPRRRRSRLRVGYVSADLFSHSVAYFLEPVWSHHDRSALEIFAYSSGVIADATTARLRTHVDQWIDCARLSDAALAQRIRDDEIDVLIDLSGHTQGNRLLALMQRPARVQATWLGFPTSTGCSAIDYRLSDPNVDPESEAGLRANVERVVRLSPSYFCYRAPADADPVCATPALSTGRITFGSFNNLSKVNDATLSVWSEVLRRVPRSDLLIKARSLGSTGMRAAFGERLQRAGIDAARVRLEGWTGKVAEHLARYHEVDLALDPSPYNGATTTCEALWMGVPVVAQWGATHAGRMGASILAAAGATAWLAADPTQYVERAAELADDLGALNRSRLELRDRLRASPLCDEAGFTGQLEQAYWRMAAESESRADD
jgi:predicted O-linked N-acetylglucosamine transferase (SPINDLY family)